MMFVQLQKIKFAFRTRKSDIVKYFLNDDIPLQMLKREKSREQNSLNL